MVGKQSCSFYYMQCRTYDMSLFLPPQTSMSSSVIIHQVFFHDHSSHFKLVLEPSAGSLSFESFSDLGHLLVDLIKVALVLVFFFLCFVSLLAN